VHVLVLGIVQREDHFLVRFVRVLDFDFGHIAVTSDGFAAAIGKGVGDKPWCSGIHLSLADIAVGCALAYLDFRFPQIDWRTRHPNLGKLADKLFARQSFIDTQPPKG